MYRKPAFKGNFTEIFCQKDVLKDFVKLTGKHMCQSITPLDGNFIKKETPQDSAQVCPVDFTKHFTKNRRQYQIFCKTFFAKHLSVSAFVFTDHDNFSTYCCTDVSAYAVISKCYFRE